jgi:hypothetical protein
MARHDIALKITPLKPPIRPSISIPRRPTLKRSTRVQRATIVKDNRLALFQPMCVYSSGRFNKFGEARERVVELVRRVARKGCLEGRAVTH